MLVTLFAVGTFTHIVFEVLFSVLSLFMILLILVQRGRGGGLAGALGGMGGQSAFGTRAGDMFTRITIVLAVVWVLLAGGMGMLMRRETAARQAGENSPFVEGKNAASDAESKDGLDAGGLDAAAPGDDQKKPADDSVTPPGETKPVEAAVPAVPDGAAASPGEPKSATESESGQPDETTTPSTPAADAPAPAAGAAAPATEPEAPATDEVPATPAVEGTPPSGTNP